MCIIQGKILCVNGTKIFVAPTKDDQQITVYMNKVEQKKKNIAIGGGPSPAPLLVLQLHPLRNLWLQQQRGLTHQHQR